MTHLGDGYQAGYMSSVIVPPREGHEAMEALQDEGTATEVPLTFTFRRQNIAGGVCKY
ncbi:hypothetical protein L916_01943 [Phytophthora nicotianae]|uniref:Uncharacterized protein n=1 Tax=Phytophthora nicotianae TaxID=4792 RepID=W2JPT3_PHYNI|nr:hypothetical protein L916_01943 [Phytophthora nicotianae]